MKKEIKEFLKKHRNKIIIVGGGIIIFGTMIYLSTKGKKSFKNLTNEDILKYLKTTSNKGSVILPARLNKTTSEVVMETILNGDPENAKVGFIMVPEIAIKILETVIKGEGA